jgi:hypothetical protein
LLCAAWAEEEFLEAFSMPIGSASAMFNQPGFAGPNGIPRIGKFPAPASPAIIATGRQVLSESNECKSDFVRGAGHEEAPEFWIVKAI